MSRSFDCYYTQWPPMTFHLYNLWKEEKERDGLMKREYIRILVIIVINIILAGIFFAVLDSLEMREELYANPTLAVIIGGGFSLLFNCDHFSHV